MLQQVFYTLINKYGGDPETASVLWDEVRKKYSEKNRFYHALDHLNHLLQVLLHVQDEVDDWDSILFALFYHDIIYKVPGQDNEEKSAKLAEERIQSLTFPAKRKARCVLHILATKSHLPCDDTDTGLFTDADLSILGQEWDSYAEYAGNIRKEYGIYPDILYIPGRKKVLNHFLHMDRIFKTGYFFNKFEQQARLNLKKELEQL